MAAMHALGVMLLSKANDAAIAGWKLIHKILMVENHVTKET